MTSGIPERDSVDARAPVRELDTEPALSRWIIAGLSLLVLLGVTGVIYFLPNKSHAAGPSALATLNAVLNGTASLFLVAGYVFIRRGDWISHRRCMLTAFGLSCVFLVSYLLHHAQVGSVRFQGAGLVRLVYLTILIPHVILAAVVVPLALLTIYRGWTARIERHKKIARITLPIWLYVSVSGVIVYLMLYA
jgi:uncharacterized membrane protein YozB (DUF420 family)